MNFEKNGTAGVSINKTHTKLNAKSTGQVKKKSGTEPKFKWNQKIQLKVMSFEIRKF